MGIRTSDREQKIYTLDPPDAIEAIVQYIEAQTRVSIPRTPDLVLNFNPDNRLVTLVVTSPQGPAVAEVKPPDSEGSLH